MQEEEAAEKERARLEDTKQAEEVTQEAEKKHPLIRLTDQCTSHYQVKAQ